jgi:hypothetical protein
MLTLSILRMKSGGKASWIKAILWNSKNINKVDPFAFRLVEQKAEQSMRFLFFSLDSLLPHSNHFLFSKRPVRPHTPM